LLVNELTVGIEQVDGYQFSVRFDKPHYAGLLMDEPPPLGRDQGPNAARVLAAAIGNCLCASLVFCAGRKAGVKLEHVRAEVKVQIVRNQDKRLRVGTVKVMIDPGLEPAAREQLAGCIGLFEDFCTVTQSIRQGVDVQVAVEGFHQA